MKTLWTVSNWKRTGPVEPTLDLAAAMERRGHEVLVATGRSSCGAPNEAGDSAAARGLTRLSLGLALRKHVGFLANRRDAARLADHLRARPTDVVQATLRNDHRIVARAVERAGLAVPIVRFWFEDGATAPSSEEGRLLARAARVVVFGAKPAATLAAAGVDPARIARLAPPLDVARVRRLAGEREAWRAKLSAPDAFVVGIVARVQRRRRFDLLWDAVERLKERRVPVVVVVVGRGTHIDEIAREPVLRRGLSGLVRFVGYLRGEDYASAIAAFDAQLLLVPGSDPTVRALREGMALGVPSVATRAGLLPDVVLDGKTGVLVDDRPDALAAAVEALAGDRARAHALGAAAALHAAGTFALPVVAERLEAVHREAVAGR